MSDTFPDAPVVEYPDEPVRERRTARNLPGGRIIPLFARDIARSVLAVPVDVARLGGHLSGNEALSQWGGSANEWLSRNVSPEARFREDPLGAALQFGGSALVPLTGIAGPVARATTAGARAVLPTAVTGSRIGQGIGAGALRAAEIALPGSAPFTAGNIILNAAAGVGIGAGVERLQDAAAEAQQQRGASQPIAASYADEPVDERALSERINDALPWAIGGIAVLSVGAAARMAMRRNAAQIASASEGSLVAPGTPTAVAPMTGLIEGLENGIFNHNAILMRRVDTAVKEGRISREVGDDIIGTVITHANSMVTSDVMRETWSTGRLPGGMRFPSPAELALEVAQLRGRNSAPDPLDATRSRDDFTRFSELMAAADELDVRAVNTRTERWMTDSLGRSTPGVPMRSALASETDATLRLRVAEGRRDPTIAALEQRYRAINNALLEYGRRNGVWSTREVANMRALGPNYMHRIITDELGAERNSPIDHRNRQENAGPARYQDPILSLEDGFRQTLEFVRRNEAVRNVATHLRETQGKVSLSGIGRVLVDNTRAKPRPGYVAVRFRGKHGARLLLELDPTISRGLLPYHRAFVPIASAARMLEQRLTTGPIGFLLGNLQAPASAAMGTMAAMINAPKHMRLGYVDKLVYQLTGERVNLRAVGFVDPTFAMQVVEAVVRGTGALTAQAIGGALQRSLVTGGPLARIVDTLGAGRAQHMADTFLRIYLNSDQHRMRREGLLAQGLAYAAEGDGVTSFSTRLSNITQMSPEFAARMDYQGFAPDISSIRSLEQLREYVTVQNARAGAVPGKITLARMWQGYSKMLDLVANSPQAAMYRYNKGVAPRHFRGMIGTARSITGDPSQYGGYRLAQGILSMVPFGNITVQAGHQMYKAFRREPAAFAVRTAMFGTMIAVATIQSAILADEAAIEEGLEPTAVAHLLTTDSRDAAAAYRFYLPGLDPERAIRLPMEQSFAPLMSAIRASIAAGFDLDDPAFFTERFTPLRDSIHRLIEDGDERRMQAALGIAGGNVPIFGAADAAARIITGSTLDNALDFATGARINPVRDEDGLGRQLINNDVTDRYTATVLEAALGFGGQALLDLWRTFGIVSREHSTGTALRATAQQYGLNIAGGGRIVGPAMFGQERRVRSNDIVGENVRLVEQKLDELTKNLGHIAGGEGTIGPLTRLREAPHGGGRPALASDMQPILVQLTRLNASFNRVQQERTDTLAALRSLNSSPQLRADPARLRRETNALAHRVRELNSMIYQQVLSVEADLSEETGRRIRIIDLDPMQGLDQFPLLPGR